MEQTPFSDEPGEVDKQIEQKFDELKKVLPDDTPMVDFGEGCSIFSTPAIEGNYLVFGIDFFPLKLKATQEIYFLSRKRLFCHYF